MKIDINCDVGEGMVNEHLLMPYISSCNIACLPKGLYVISLTNFDSFF